MYWKKPFPLLLLSSDQGIEHHLPKHKNILLGIKKMNK
jgi:hypothetical protein